MNKARVGKIVQWPCTAYVLWSMPYQYGFPCCNNNIMHTYVQKYWLYTRFMLDLLAYEKSSPK